MHRTTSSRISEPRVAFVREEGIVEPGAARFVPDQIEALIELGRRDEAVELLDWYEGSGGVSSAPPRWRTARAAVCSQRRRRRASTKPWRTTRRRSPFIGRSSFRRPRSHASRPRSGPTTREAPPRGACDARGGTRCLRANRRGALGGAYASRRLQKRISGRAASRERSRPPRSGSPPLSPRGRRTARSPRRSSCPSGRSKVISHVFAKLGIKHRAEVAPALASRQTQGMAGQLQGVHPFQRGRSLPGLEAGGQGGHRSRGGAMTHRMSLIIRSPSLHSPSASRRLSARGASSRNRQCRCPPSSTSRPTSSPRWQSGESVLTGYRDPYRDAFGQSSWKPAGRHHVPRCIRARGAGRRQDWTRVEHRQLPRRVRACEPSNVPVAFAGQLGHRDRVAADRVGLGIRLLLALGLGLIMRTAHSARSPTGRSSRARERRGARAASAFCKP